MLNNFIRQKIKEYDNTWLKFIVLFLVTTWIIHLMFFSSLVRNAQNAPYSLQKESEIMYYIHDISNNSKIKKFDIIALIGGDRIFIVEYAIDSEDCNKITSLREVFKEMDWKETNYNSNVFSKEDFLATIKKVDNNTVNVKIASINTTWGRYYFNFIK